MKHEDEYIWADYTKEYSAQLKEIQEKENRAFFITHFDAKAEPYPKVIINDNLHPNWMELYSTAFLLQPKSVFECGFGCAHHLKNISTLLPQAEIAGCDLLQTQLDFAKQFSSLPEKISSNLFVQNLTDATFEPKQQYEFVYSQAVVMHLSTEHAISFMRNMAKLSSRYIFMVEGVANHNDWYNLVQKTLPEFEFSIVGNYIDNGILLKRRAEN